MERAKERGGKRIAASTRGAVPSTRGYRKGWGAVGGDLANSGKKRAKKKSELAEGGGGVGSCGCWSRSLLRVSGPRWPICCRYRAVHRERGE